MKPCTYSKLIISSILAFSLAACNLPGQASAPMPTETQILPTPTQEPSATSLPPSEAPTQAPTPSWTVPPPPIKPTKTFTPVPTKGIQPAPGAKFEANFDGGAFVFYTSDKGTMVTPRQIRLRKASCRGGRTISDALSFEPPQYYSITNGQFTISWESKITIFGFFTGPKQASGSIELEVTKNDKTCVIGPVDWVASTP